MVFNKPRFCNVNVILIANTLAWLPVHCHERKKSQGADIYTTAKHCIPFAHHSVLFSK